MAKQEPHYETIYTGSDVNVQYLQSVLEKASISSIIKNNFESGLRAGFGGGLPGQVQLQVQKSHASEARKIAEAAFDNE